MRVRDLNAAVAEANPVDRERSAAFRLPADHGALLDAIAGEPVPAAPATTPRRYRNLALLLIVLAAAVAASAFTAPGRAVSDWVGEKLGFGEPGGPPSLRQLNEGWAKGSDLEGQPQYVLVVGPITGRERSRYEFITYHQASRPDRPAWFDGPCFKLDLTQVRSMYTQGCGTLPEGRQFAYLGVGGGYGHAYAGEDGVRFSDELFHLSGRAGPEVTSVEASVDGREIPVQLRPVPATLRQRFDLGPPFSFFVGFFSGVPRGGTVEVTARGDGGEVLGHAKTELVDQVESAKLRCRMMLESGDRLPRAGREECRHVLGGEG